MSASSATPAPLPVAPATAATLNAAVDGIVSSLAGLSGSGLLAALPGVIVAAYQAVVAFMDATSATQQAALLTALQAAIAKLSLSPADQLVVNALLSDFIPKLVQYLPEIEKGAIAGFHTVEADVQSCCGSCWSKFVGIF